MTIAKTRAFGHDADIGQQTHDDSGADSDTVNRCNDRFRAIQHFVDDVSGLLQYRDNLFVVSVRVLYPVEVPTRREGPAGPRQYHNARFGVTVDHRPKIPEPDAFGHPPYSASRVCSE